MRPITTLVEANDGPLRAICDEAAVAVVGLRILEASVSHNGRLSEITRPLSRSAHGHQIALVNALSLGRLAMDILSRPMVAITRRRNADPSRRTQLVLRARRIEVRKTRLRQALKKRLEIAVIAITWRRANAVVVSQLSAIKRGPPRPDARGRAADTRRHPLRPIATNRR